MERPSEQPPPTVAEQERDAATLLARLLRPLSEPGLLLRSDEARRVFGAIAWLAARRGLAEEVRERVGARAGSGGDAPIVHALPSAPREPAVLATEHRVERDRHVVTARQLAVHEHVETITTTRAPARAVVQAAALRPVAPRAIETPTSIVAPLASAAPVHPASPLVHQAAATNTPAVTTADAPVATIVLPLWTRPHKPGHTTNDAPTAPPLRVEPQTSAPLAPPLVHQASPGGESATRDSAPLERGVVSNVQRTRTTEHTAPSASVTHQTSVQHRGEHDPRATRQQTRSTTSTQATSATSTTITTSTTLSRASRSAQRPRVTPLHAASGARQANAFGAAPTPPHTPTHATPPRVTPRRATTARSGPPAIVYPTRDERSGNTPPASTAAPMQTLTVDPTFLPSGSRVGAESAAPFVSSSPYPAPPPPSSTAPPIVSAAPPVALDVDALVDKVHQKLQRLAAQERTRRGLPR